MELILDRTYLEKGTNGDLWCNGNLVCHTIELPFWDNLKGLSCIPEGQYFIGLRRSQRFGLHLHIRNVKDREYILFHRANNALKELRGCIAPVWTLSGAGKGLNSSKAFNRLMELVRPVLSAHEKVMLTIKSKIL